MPENPTRHSSRPATRRQSGSVSYSANESGSNATGSSGETPANYPDSGREANRAKAVPASAGQPGEVRQGSRQADSTSGTRKTKKSTAAVPPQAASRRITRKPAATASQATGQSAAGDQAGTGGRTAGSLSRRKENPASPGGPAKARREAGSRQTARDGQETAGRPPRASTGAGARPRNDSGRTSRSSQPPARGGDRQRDYQAPASRSASPEQLSAVQSPQRGRQPAAGRQTPAGEARLRVIPLGGMREIGKNMTVYEYGDDLIIVDCGIAFPDEDMPGIDVVIPDFSYIQQNLHKLRAVFLTHGHEDHIGALPWFCKEFQTPVYGNRLSIELVRGKLDDRGTGAANVSLIPVRDGDVVTVGAFSVEFIHVNHSIADANALAIRTPAGIIYHSGDFKVDHTPINGGPMDLARIGAIGDEGVLLMVCESTNIERKGYTPSESKVGETFAELFGKASGRIFVTTFSSNVSRVQQVFTAAEQYGRKVALIGRSMLNVFNAANALGYIAMQPDTLIDVNQIDRYDADRLVLITTGSQGEPMSALTRMAFSEHRSVEIVPGDTVILSSSAIPGNEKSVYRVINELYKRGARVIYESLSEIHVSGHAYQEELKLLHNLVRPRYFIPAHGEYRHLYRHAELARQLGTDWENIFLLNNGDIFEYAVHDDEARISGFTAASGVLIDGTSVGDIDNLVLRERRLLADDGVVTLFIGISRQTGELLGQPDIQARGFIYESESERVIQECQKKIQSFARKTTQANKPLAAVIRSGQLHDQLRDLLFERTRRRPVILISVLEI